MAAGPMTLYINTCVCSAVGRGLGPLNSFTFPLHYVVVRITDFTVVVYVPDDVAFLSAFSFHSHKSVRFLLHFKGCHGN